MPPDEIDAVAGKNWADDEETIDGGGCTGVEIVEGRNEDDAGIDENDAGIDKDDAGIDGNDAGIDKDDAGIDEDDAGIDEDDVGIDEDDAGINEDGGETEVWIWSEDGGEAGREAWEGRTVFEDSEKSDGVVQVDVAATAGPVCDNAMKGAITDGGKSGIDWPWSAVRPSADSTPLSPPESLPFSSFAPSWANRPLAVDLGMISSSFWRIGQPLWSMALSIVFFYRK